MLIAYILSLVTAVMWGVSTNLENVVLQSIDYITLFFIFGIVNGISALVLLCFKRDVIMKDIKNCPSRLFILAIITSLLAIVISNLVYLKAVSFADQTNIHIVAALAFSAPLFTALVAILYFKKIPSVLSILGVVLIVTGAIILTMMNN